MLKLIFITFLIVYVASIPLDERKTPPKSYENEDHVLNKRSDHVASQKAFANKEEKQQKNQEAQQQNNEKTIQSPKHLKKRETEQIPSTKSEKNERKIRDLSKEKPESDRKSRDTWNQQDDAHQHQYHSSEETSNVKDKDKPKDIVHDIPTKAIQKRDTEKDEPRKNIENDENNHQNEHNKRPTRETLVEVEEKKSGQKPKRQTNEPKPNANDAKNQQKTGSFSSGEKN